MSVTDPYKILQVDPEAEDEVIAAAYRRLARKYHPDTATAPGSAGRMEAINAAWELIGQPTSRAAFDRRRAVEAAMARSAFETGPPPGSAPRTASTGQAPRSAAGSASTARDQPPETVSRDWSSGRSTIGGGYDQSMRKPDGEGAAGRPPGDPSGSVMNFGRYSGWSLGEIARSDLEYLEWLDRMPIGRPYRDEIDGMLRQSGRRRSADAEKGNRRGLFRRR